MEPLHEHDWCVEVVFRGPKLDTGGMLIDFTSVQDQLNKIIARMDGTNLNENIILAGRPSSAECVARALFSLLNTGDPRQGTLRRVVVHEAPGCSAAFEPG